MGNLHGYGLYSIAIMYGDGLIHSMGKCEASE